MEPDHVAPDLAAVLASEEEIQTRIGALAREIERDYAGRDLLLVGVLDGAAMVTTDLARALDRHVEISWLAISTYGLGTRSSGAVRPRKDIDVDITGRHVLVLDGVIDTGLTASWLLSNLRSRGPASVAFCALFRKPTAHAVPDVKYVGFDVPSGVIVGYGLDFAGRYRNLRCCALLAPHVHQAKRSAPAAQAPL